MTRYFAVIFNTPAEKVTLRPEHFRPWINSDPDEDMRAMVLHRHVRFRGGTGGERLEAKVFETNPRGAVPCLPMPVWVTDYTLHPE